ncbi:hypothetical protein [Streptomyces sp. NPDC051577]|uniref:hypothetical protein n=1 Tax=Streptomyces sp. NPDC051577 TaxID=3155166 RepID=UPI0034486FE1
MTDYRSELAEKMSRALARAHALIEEWTDDLTPLTRDSAADIFGVVLELNGWEQTDLPQPALPLVTERSTP